MDQNKNNSSVPDGPLKDYGSLSHAPIEDQDIAAHHTDRWQHQAMYVGLHFPKNREKRGRHRHKHNKQNQSNKKREITDTNESNSSKPDFVNDDELKEENILKPKRNSIVFGRLLEFLSKPFGVNPSTPPSQRVHFILGENADENDEEHRPHDIFCEMDELRGVDGEKEWKETARWIKFEEVVEEGAEKWSKPHVATLSLHALFELRKGITSGTVLLDSSGENLQDVISLVLDSMISSKQLESEQRNLVYDILMCRHRHQHETTQGLPLIRSLADIGKRHSEKKIDEKDNEKPGDGEQSVPLDVNLPTGNTVNSLEPNKMENADMHHVASTQSHKMNVHFMKKIPPGSEASNILVGEVDFLKSPVIAFVRLAKSVMLGDLTEVPLPTRFLFILLGPEGNQADYHEIGRSIATLMSDEVFHDVAYKAKSREDLLSGIDEFLDQVTVLPPGEWDPNIRIEPPKSVPSQQGRKGPITNGGSGNADEDEESHTDPTLLRTGRIFGGLISDVKRKIPFYCSDFKDALSIQCLASFFFMYFACLTPIVTFGGLLHQATKGNLGVMESIVGATITGVTYHLFSGQPLTIIGSTGPVLVFETICFDMCKSYNINYLAFRFWIGLWCSLFLLLIVMFDLSSLVRYITRFTEELFAALIAAIFIFESFDKIIHIHKSHPINYPGEIGCVCTFNKSSKFFDYTQETLDDYYNKNSTIMTKLDCLKLNGTLEDEACKYGDNVFFFSALLFLGTFTVAISLKNMRNTRFFPQKVRVIISDFSVFIAILSFVGIDAYMRLDTDKLHVPTTFKPTNEGRTWIVHPFPSENPKWVPILAAAPALLATILLFMDQQITAVIVNRKENKLVKGCGYHLDLFIIALQIGLCSVMGIPWFVAATVLSINHVRSLSMESKCSAPGERPKYMGVREQRVTGILVFLSIGLAVLMTRVLNFIPLPVLYGVFLYMGVSSLKGVQLVQRIMILFMPPKYQPDYIFLRNVRILRVHIFTAIQIVCFVLLWIIKKTKMISITFPLMVMAMCFIRKLLDFVFTRKELIWLDDVMPESHKREKHDKKKLENIEQDNQSNDDNLHIRRTLIASGKPSLILETIDTNNIVMSTLSTNINQETSIELEGSHVDLPLQDGKSIRIPVEKIRFDVENYKVNISDDIHLPAVWNQISSIDNSGDNRHPTVTGTYRKRSIKDKKVRRQSSNDPQSQETQKLISMPSIVVDPPESPVDSKPVQV